MNRASLTSKTGRSNLSRRDEWGKVLDVEVGRWSAMPYEDLISALGEHQEYQVDFREELQRERGASGKY